MRGHDAIPNHMNEFLLSEVDWGVHDSSFFLFLVNLDYDAMPKDFFPQELWGGLPHRTSSTPLLESCGREVGTSSGTSERSKPSGSPVGPTVGLHTKLGPPTIIIRSRSVPKPMPEFDHYSLLGRTFLLPPEACKGASFLVFLSCSI